MAPTFALFSLSPMEIMILLGIGVLLFGRKLPEMGKMLGKGLVEFKKGIGGIEDEVMGSMNAPPRHEPLQPAEPPRPPQRITATAPKFEENVTTTNPNNITNQPGV